MGNFYWLKLKKDFYKRHDIVILESMENGKEIELIYIKMLCEAIDHYGELRFNEHIAYTPKLPAPLFNTTEEMIKLALSVLRDLELLDIKEDGTIQMTKMGSFIGYETDMAEKKRIQRNLPTLKNGSKRLNGTCLVTPDMKKHTVDEKRYGGHGMQALDRAFGKCELCGSDKEVRIHHNNGYSNELDDLVCLCASCHGIAHNKKNRGHVKINRPPYVHHLSATCPPNVHRTEDTCPTNVGLDIDIDKEKDIDIDIDSLSREPPRKNPTLDEIVLFCSENKINVDPNLFFKVYSETEWKIDGKPIRNWKALLITWGKNKTWSKEKDIKYMQNEYSKEHIRQKEEESIKALDDLLED